MTKNKCIKLSKNAKLPKLSSLWVLMLPFLMSTLSLSAAGQSSDGSASTSAERVAQTGGTSPLPNHPEPLCKRREVCLRGVADDFAAPAEEASPSRWLIEKMGGCKGVHSEFDTDPPDGYCFGHSFSKCLNETCKVTGARLEIRMQAIRSLSTNDDITIYSGGLHLWSKQIITLVEAGNAWSPPQTATFVIDLGALPGGGNILNQITSSVDVTVQDDTRIDFMRLTVHTDCCGKACGAKYLDKNGNGIKDEGESYLCGWTMILDNGQDNAQTTTTGIDGGYCFDKIRPGDYTLGEIVQTGWTQTSPPPPGQHTLNISAGQLVDGLDFGNRPCKFGCTPEFALDFDGEDDYVEVLNADLISGKNGIDNSDFTFEVWVKGLESEQGSHPPIMQNRSKPDGGFFLGFHNKWGGSAHMIPFIKLGGKNFVFTNPPNLLDGRWHHFVATKKGNTLTYFVDGSPVKSFIESGIGIASIADTGPLMIGWDQWTSGFDGTIDNLCIWKTARTQCEILTDMITLPAATAPDLVACWSMDEGLGQIIGDYVASHVGRLGSTFSADNSDPVWVGANH